MNVKVGTHTFLQLHALHATGSSYFYRMKYFVSRLFLLLTSQYYHNNNCPLSRASTTSATRRA